MDRFIHLLQHMLSYVISKFTTPHDRLVPNPVTVTDSASTITPTSVSCADNLFADVTAGSLTTMIVPSDAPVIDQHDIDSTIAGFEHLLTQHAAGAFDDTGQPGHYSVFYGTITGPGRLDEDVIDLPRELVSTS